MKEKTLEKIVFIIAIISFFYCVIPRIINIYSFKVTGAIFELLSLPMLASFFCLPVIAALFWIKNRFSFRTLHAYSLFLSILTLILLFNS